MNDIKTDDITDRNIDEWIDIFKQRLLDAKTDEKKEEMTKALDILSDVKVNITTGNNTISDELIIHVKLIYDSFKNIFNSWNCDAYQSDDRIMLSNDVLYIEIMEEQNSIWCLLSFRENTNPILSAEIAITMHDIFDIFLSINPEVFAINPLNNERIWGEENINAYKRSIKPIRINPITIMADSSIGNC